MRLSNVTDAPTVALHNRWSNQIADGRLRSIVYVNVSRSPLRTTLRASSSNAPGAANEAKMCVSSLTTGVTDTSPIGASARLPTRARPNAPYAIRDFMPKALGSRVTEQIVLNDGTVGGCWFTVNNKSYDVAYTRDNTGTRGRFHHITYAVDQREHILQAADVFLENGVHIETGPHKHAVQQTFFLYVYEPGGNRVEVANAGARLMLAPDWQPVIWTEAERKKGQAWGLKTIETFHTHGTPPVRKEAAE